MRQQIKNYMIAVPMTLGVVVAGLGLIGGLGCLIADLLFNTGDEPFRVPVSMILFGVSLAICAGLVAFVQAVIDWNQVNK